MKPPLCVDLDGTLLRTDMLFETLMVAVRQKPWVLVLLPFWLFAGRAVLKRRLAEVAAERLEIDLLPVTEDLVDYLLTEKARGRRIELVSASDLIVLRSIAARWGDLFDDLLGSDGVVNLKGSVKADRLADRHPDGFAYAGDHAADLAVWRRASSAIVVNGARRRRRQIAELAPIEAEFGQAPDIVSVLRSALRVHQWTKNTLIFLPLLLTSAYLVPALVIDALVAFLAFSLTASGTYLVNDLLDLAADRAHPTKRRRALASGRLPIDVGLVLATLLIALGVGLAAIAGSGVLLCLLTYLAVTTLYSVALKAVAIVDVVTLGGLFTLRLLAGHMIIDGGAPVWLLVFSMFLFTSLALVKRLVEVRGLEARGGQSTPGRGYRAGDSAFILILGLTTGVASVLVFMIYLVAEPIHAQRLADPHWLWVVLATIGFWILRVWLLAARGQVHDDPVVFALKDPPTLVLGSVALAAVLAAA